MGPIDPLFSDDNLLLDSIQFQKFILYLMALIISPPFADDNLALVSENYPLFDGTGRSTKRLNGAVLVLFILWGQGKPNQVIPKPLELEVNVLHVHVMLLPVLAA